MSNLHVFHNLNRFNSNKTLAGSLVGLLLVSLCLVGVMCAPNVHAATNWTLTTRISGSQSSPYGSMTISGTETIRLTESNGQLSGTGNIELTMSGMGSDMYAT